MTRRERLEIPWEEVLTKIAVGDQVSGIVVSTRYGVIELRLDLGANGTKGIITLDDIHQDPTQADTILNNLKPRDHLAATVTHLHHDCQIVYLTLLY